MLFHIHLYYSLVSLPTLAETFLSSTSPSCTLICPPLEHLNVAHGSAGRGWGGGWAGNSSVSVELLKVSPRCSVGGWVPIFTEGWWWCKVNFVTNHTRADKKMYIIVMVWEWDTSPGFMFHMLVPQLVVLFWEVVKTLGDGGQALTRISKLLGYGWMLCQASCSIFSLCLMSTMRWPAHSSTCSTQAHGVNQPCTEPLETVSPTTSSLL